MPRREARRRLVQRRRRRCRRARRRRPRASSRSAVAAPMPPAPPVTMAIRPARLFGFGIRCSFASSSSQYSMSKASCSGSPRYSRDRRRPAHHVDRVDVELARDPRRRLVLGEGDHADAGHEIDDRVRVAHRRAVGPPAALVVAGIVRAVFLDRRRQPGERRRRGRASRDRTPPPADGSWCAGNGPGSSSRAPPAAPCPSRSRTPAPPRCRRNGRPCARPARSCRGCRHQRRGHRAAAPRAAAPRARSPPNAGVPVVCFSSQPMARLMISSVVS